MSPEYIGLLWDDIYVYIYINGCKVLRVRQQIRGKIIILNFTQFIHDDIHPHHVQQVVVIHVYIIIIIIIILHGNDPRSRDLLCTLHTFIYIIRITTDEKSCFNVKSREPVGRK